MFKLCDVTAFSSHGHIAAIVYRFFKNSYYEKRI
jgi:hypothetical protein